MARKLRIGIAGVGRGAQFAPALAAMPEVEIAAICDVDPKMIERTKEGFGSPAAFDDYGQMLDSGIDAALIATPMDMHVPMCAAALERNIHALSEVTAATSLEQARDLVAAVRASKAKYMMAENYCYMKPFQLARNMARAGVFGEIYYAEGAYLQEAVNLSDQVKWRDRWLFGRRGATYPSHTLGPILDCMDDYVTTVMAVGTGPRNYSKFSSDDCSILLCQTSRGGMIEMRHDLTSVRPNMFKYISLQGTKGAYEAKRHDDDSHRVCLRDAPSKEGRRWQPLSDFEEEYLPEIVRNPPPEIARAGDEGGCDYFTLRAFVEAILGDTPPPIDVYRALDFTLPGLMSEVSILQGGAPVAVPNFRFM